MVGRTIVTVCTGFGVLAKVGGTVGAVVVSFPLYNLEEGGRYQIESKLISALRVCAWSEGTGFPKMSLHERSQIKLYDHLDTQQRKVYAAIASDVSSDKRRWDNAFRVFKQVSKARPGERLLI